MPASELNSHIGRELFVSDWIVVPLEQELAFQAATLLTKEHLGFEPAGDDPYGAELVSRKNTNWEGAFRVPEVIRWPGRIPAGVVSNEIVSHLDWLPTLVAAAGNPEVKQKLLDGMEANGKRFRVHLDG